MNKPKINDLCWFWNSGIKYPVLGKLLNIFEDKYSEIIVYSSDTSWIGKDYTDHVEYNEIDDFYYCEKFNGSLPDYFKNLKDIK